MWWKDILDVHLQSYSKGHIDLLIKEGLGEGKCFLTGFYRHPKVEKRRASWKLMRCLSHSRDNRGYAGEILLKFYMAMRKKKSVIEVMLKCNCFMKL